MLTYRYRFALCIQSPEYDIPVAQAVEEEQYETSPYNSYTRNEYCEEPAVVPATGVDQHSHEREYGAVQEVPPPGSTTAPSKKENSSASPPWNDFGPYEFWKHGLCTCCDVFFEPLFWMSFCCTPLVFGQLMTRMKLDWCGKPDVVHAGRKTFGAVALIFIAFLIVYFAGLKMAALVFWIYTLIIYTRTRRAIRRHFRIPAQTCQGDPSAAAVVEDCCCALFCGCCSGMQMARHTHNEDKYPYTVCATNGLPTYAPGLAVAVDGDGATFAI